jgi:branched-subunit amino acid transport protein
VITCCFWYGRNFIYALNPFPQIRKIGPIHLPGPNQVDLYPRPPHKLAEYYNDPLVWTHKLTPVLHERLGPLWPVILIVVVVALLWAFIKGGSALMRILAATGMVAGIAYIFTPLTASGQPYDGSGFDANLRYVSPVLMVGFLLLPLIPWFRHGRRPWIPIVLFTALLIQGTVIQTNWEFKHHLASIGLAFLIVGVPALMVAGFRRRLSPVLLVSFGLVMAITAVALGRVRDDYYLDHRYVTASRPPLGGGFRASPEWQPLQDWGRKASHERIGVFGRASAFGQYFFYGNDLTNHVQYLGDEGNHGTFRPIYNCALWRQTINQGHYDYVVTTPALGVIETVAPPQNLWTSSDPNVRTVIQSGPAAVYKIDGPLDPSTCAQLGDLSHT